MHHVIFGVNPVLEALQSNPQKIHQLFLPTEDLTGKRKLIFSLGRQHGIKIQRIPLSRFDVLVGSVVHQGVVAEVTAQEYQSLDTLVAGWKASKEKALFVVLDSIEDPHNLGAIIRTAHVVGSHGVIVPKHRSAPLSGTAVKAAAGASAHIPVCRVPNLVSALNSLKQEGIWIAGTSEKATRQLYQLDLTMDLAVVIGSEGKGMHELVIKTCDFLISIPTKGTIHSLNASVAAGVVLFEVLRQRQYR
ncbi:MAG TPA: 23S rRNA (guanosine(2251)-2'-O)-methyltransferase RlmB [Thermodesulfobacteriota bacterium]|nr:23S rRNA (guanosine(2251)-2'-O)-methyltransferase RlmB [Deltaproteobacteria bacterium]HNR13213.1 23S rRNA (guanosine(2251)-2'-O)-methyltransferase RlmB [Thermodesulfobacteriota bacterium]HOC37959.1 23S rRNA (guanosine(2251)-2'-O)-methyltransferase RlmB [Thermodesulfobacteriota bacterium]HQO77948.1 23S rRNA (guanosine(2251)-2'-O)-methyltransferase RlmB [Thermodesulfobacteriota bacterium]